MEFITQNISFFGIASALLVAILLFIYLFLYEKSDRELLGIMRENARRKKRWKEKNLEIDNNKRMKLERQENFLKSSGLYYMTKGKISLRQFKIASVIIAAACTIVGFELIGIAGALLGVVIGIVLPTMVLNASNEQDNNAMLDSIKDVYDTLRIQASNDIYITDSLYECYVITKHPRLKSALIELVSEIHGSGDIEKAVDNFNAKFKNPYVDSLAISIKQALLSGSAAQIFADVSKQIDAIDEAIIIREEEKAQRLNTIVQALVYIVILAMVFYFAIIAASDIFTIF